MKRYLILLLITLIPLFSMGQVETLVKIHYMPGLSLGETADFTKNLSPRGMDFEVSRFFSEQFSAGISLGWNVFREKVTGESFEFRNALITGTQFRYTNIIPINMTAKKYFGEGEWMPFIGMGLGTSYARMTNNAGIFSFVDNKWQFNMTPEAGIEARIDPSVLFTFKIKYSYSAPAGDFPGMSFLGFGVGIGIF